MGFAVIHGEVQDLGKLLHQKETSAQMSRIRGREFPVVGIDVRNNRGQGPGKVMDQGQIDDGHRQAREATPLRNTSAGQGGCPEGVVEEEEPAIGHHGVTPSTKDAKRDTQLPAGLKDGGSG